MKTNFLLIGLMAAGIICSCEREADFIETASPQPENGTEVIIHATMVQEGSTKTILQEDGAVFWQPEDQIAVFFNTVRVPFTAFNSVDAASAYFVGNTDLSLGHNENSDGNPAGEYVYWGLYPLNASIFSERYNASEFYYDNNLLWAYLMESNGDFSYEYGQYNIFLTPSHCSGNEVSTILYDWQKGVENTFDTQLNIALAKSDDYHELAFYNVLGGVRFMLQSSDITRVTFKGNGGEALAGKFSVTMDDNGKPLITEVSIPSETITVSLENDEAFKPGVWYYAMMFPGTLSKGYTMEFYTSNSSAKKVVTSSVEVKRSVFGSLENPDKDLSYEPLVHAASLTLDVQSISLSVGQSRQLVASVSPSDCTFPVVWKSSNPEIVSVDENGKVTAIANGTSEVYASCDRLTGYVYVEVGEGGQTSGGEAPSFEIVSADLSGADALALMSANAVWYTGEDANCIYKIDQEGNSTPLRFTFSCADKEIEQQMNDNAWVSGVVYWMTDKYIVINNARVYCEGVIDSYGERYGNDLYQCGNCFAIRLSDSRVFLIRDNEDRKYRTFRFDERLRYHWYTQRLNGIFRWSYDGTRLYSVGSESECPFYWFTLSDGLLDAQSSLDFSSSSFRVGGNIILDKNNNLAYLYYYNAYVFFDDGGMADIPLPEDYSRYRIIENDYNWYLICSNYDELAVYQIQVSGHEVSVTPLVVTTDVGDFDFSILRNDDVIVLIDKPNIVTFNPETKELTNTSLDEAFPNVNMYDREYDAYGICYELADGVITKYDLVNQTIETINTDRSNVPQMTPTNPSYDSTNNCFYETGTRYSDTKTITVVTDCATGKVTVYEGAYESIFKSYLKLSY